MDIWQVGRWWIDESKSTTSSTGWVKVTLSKHIEFWFRNGESQPKEYTMTSMAAIYARVSSTSQKQEETIASQTSALKDYAKTLALAVRVERALEADG